MDGEAISANVAVRADFPNSPDESAVIGLQAGQSLLPFETQMHDSMNQCSTATLASDREKLQFSDALDLACKGIEGSLSKITVGEKEKSRSSNLESGSMQSKEISAPKLLGTDTPEGLENTTMTTGDDNQLNSWRKSNENMSSTTNCSELSHESFMNCQSDQSSQIKGGSRHSSNKDQFSASNVCKISTARNCFESPLLVPDGDGGSDFKGSDYGNNGDSTAGDSASSVSTKSSADSVATKTMSLPEGREEPIYCDGELPRDRVSKTNGATIRANISKTPDKSVVIGLQGRPTPLTIETQNYHSTGQCSTANFASDRDKPGGIDTSHIVSIVNEGSFCESIVGEKGGLSMNHDLEPGTEISAPVSSIGDRNEASLSTTAELASKQDSNSGLNCRNDHDFLDLESECDDRCLSHSKEKNGITSTIPARCSDFVDNVACRMITLKDSTIPASGPANCSEDGSASYSLPSCVKKGTLAEIDSTCSESNEIFDRCSRSPHIQTNGDKNEVSSNVPESWSSVTSEVVNAALMLRKSRKKPVVSNASLRTTEPASSAHTSFQITSPTDIIENLHTSSTKEDADYCEHNVASLSRGSPSLCHDVQGCGAGQECYPDSFRPLPKEFQAQDDCSSASKSDGLEQRTQRVGGLNLPQSQMTQNQLRHESNTDVTFGQWVRLTQNLLDSNPNNLHRMLEKLHSIQNDDSSVRMPQL